MMKKWFSAFSNRLKPFTSPVNKAYKNSLGKYVDSIEAAYPFPVKVGKYAVKGFLAVAGILFLLYILIMTGAFGIMPSKKDLREIKNYTASEIYTADSVLIGKYFIQNRTNATYDELPQYLIDALVATEDSRFYEHKGIDFFSFVRVLVFSVILNDESSGGGSTISQQLAKNLFARKNYSILSVPVNKMREMIIAGRLERIYSKKEILTLYFNTVPFGENCYGIEAGALRFFNTSPSNLKPEQATVLVGLLKANSTYNPRTHPDKSQERRNVVLNQMVRYNYLSQPEADSLKKIPLEINYRNETETSGTAAYFKEYLRTYLDEWTKENPKENGDSWNIYTDGLRIYTTLNSHLQQYAEDAVNTQMAILQQIFYKHWNNKDPWGKSTTVITNAIKRSDRYQNMLKGGKSEEEIMDFFSEDTVEATLFSWKGEIDTLITPQDSVKYSLKFLQTGFLAMEPSTGNILAWVGGIDQNIYKYDHVTAKRQVGSTFKPILYAAALENGIEPCTYIANEKKNYTQYGAWSPSNADGNYGGKYSMMGGLTHSVNTVAAQLMDETGPQKVIALAKKMGINSKLPAVPSLALGSADISLFEMVKAYCAIDNRGLAVEPQFVTLIISSENDTVYKQKQNKKTRAMSQETADIMIQMMQNVINNGTAARLRGTFGLTMDLAGKTGTTQSNTDGWFIGFTPRIVAGAWVGAEDPAIRFRSTALGQGAATALPIFGKFIGKTAKDKQTKKYAYATFTTPADSVMQRLDCAMWLPDSINFIQKVIGNIRDIINRTQKKDSIQQFNFPGSEDQLYK